MRDIATVAGVSAASVSRVMRDPKSVSERTRTRVEKAVQKIKGDELNGNESSTVTLGCAFLDWTCNSKFGGYDAVIWSGLARVANQRGADLTVLRLEDVNSPEDMRKLLRKHSISGLAIRCDENAHGLLEILNEMDVPTLTIAHRHEFDRIGYICVESQRSSCDAVEHLIRLGHKRIAFCSNLIRDYDHEERRRGYREALQKHGLEFDPALEIHTHTDPEGGITAINRLLAVPNPPTAIYFADPVPTVTALRRLSELNIRVPEDMSIFGFDDDDTRQLGNPVYSSVCQDAEALADMSGQLLLRMINSAGNSVVPRLELDSFIEINGTTGPAPR